MDRYYYEGPVVRFDKCICNKYMAETVAKSPSKAKSNIAYRFKLENNMIPSTKIILPGKIFKEEVQ